MLPVRVDFDLALPVVAAQSFPVGERTFNDGDPFPWCELGINEVMLHSFWRSGLIRFELPEPAAIAAPAQPQRRSRAAR